MKSKRRNQRPPVKVKWRRNPYPVLIRWQDAQGGGDGWTELKLFKKWSASEWEPLIQSVGMLMGQTRQYLILTACCQNSGDHYGRLLRIPRGCILTVEKLRRNKARKYKDA